MYFKTANMIISKVALIGAGCCREIVFIFKQHIRISEKGLL